MKTQSRPFTPQSYANRRSGLRRSKDRADDKIRSLTFPRPQLLCLSGTYLHREHRLSSDMDLTAPQWSHFSCTSPARASLAPASPTASADSLPVWTRCLMRSVAGAADSGNSVPVAKRQRDWTTRADRAPGGSGSKESRPRKTSGRICEGIQTVQGWSEGTWKHGTGFQIFQCFEKFTACLNGPLQDFYCGMIRYKSTRQLLRVWKGYNVANGNRLESWRLPT
jgi:hypothetical protein